MALMAALVHRHIYSTSKSIMREALALPTLPAGYAELVGMVTAGKLDNKARVVAALETVFRGIGPWLAQHDVALASRTQWPWA